MASSRSARSIPNSAFSAPSRVRVLPLWAAISGEVSFAALVVLALLLRGSSASSTSSAHDMLPKRFFSMTLEIVVNSTLPSSLAAVKSEVSLVRFALEATLGRTPTWSFAFPIFIRHPHG